MQPLIERVFDGAPAGVLFALPGTPSPGRLTHNVSTGSDLCPGVQFQGLARRAAAHALGMFHTFRAE